MTQLDPVQAPIVIELGKVKNKKIKQLKRGEGELVDEVNEAMAQLQTRLGEQSNGKSLVPVVIVYRKKPSRRRRAALPWMVS
jgi:hypothetical protein